LNEFVLPEYQRKCSSTTFIMNPNQEIKSERFIAIVV
jgi:hypothetical protein